MLKEVDQHIATGETDEQILQAFVQAYGKQVYTEPPKSGFRLLAWVCRAGYICVGVGVCDFRDCTDGERSVEEMRRRAAPQVFP